jgi:hypothetical protein
MKRNEPIEVFVDADWASDFADAVSVTGYVIKLAGGAISWSSKKQSLPKKKDDDEEVFVIANSSTHSEYFALYEVSIEVEWLQSLLTELGQGKFVSCPITVFADNMSSIKLAYKEGHSDKTENINVKYHYIRALIKNGLIELVHVKSVNNQADLFTKILSGVRTYNLTSLIGIY